MSPSLPPRSNTRTVALGAEGLKINDRRYPLVSAGVEPWRLRAETWPRILDTIKDLGIDIVSAILCWDYHEVERGHFDFVGETDPSRNLMRFIELCAERDIFFIPRPGPYIDASWETRGPPPDVAGMDRLDPRFLSRARDWIVAVSSALAPHQYEFGGPVILLCVDNEVIYPWTTSDTSHRIEGTLRMTYDGPWHDREFRRWLQARHTLPELNQTLGTDFQRWEEVRIPQFGAAPSSLISVNFAFMNDRVAEYLRVCSEMFRDSGISVPLFTNDFYGVASIDWVNATTTIASVGTSLFFPADLPEEDALQANWWLRLHRARFGQFAWASDVQSGISIGRTPIFGALTEEHTEYVPMVAQAAGLRGVNFYLLVERDDWAYSPITPTGKGRPGRLERIRNVVRSYKSLDVADVHLADVGLLWSPVEHSWTAVMSDRDWSTFWEHENDPARIPESSNWWSVFRSILDRDTDFRIWLPGVSTGVVPRVLIYAGIGFAEPSFLESLALTPADTTILCASPLPRRDVSGRPNSSMAEIASELERSGRAIPVVPDDVAMAASIAGARSYSRSGRHGVWTYLSTTSVGDRLLGVWNASGEQYDGLITLDEGLFRHTPVWLVDEPRVEEVARLLATDCQVPVSIPRRSARVYRLRPDQSYGPAKPSDMKRLARG